MEKIQRRRLGGEDSSEKVCQRRFAEEGLSEIVCRRRSDREGGYWKRGLTPEPTIALIRFEMREEKNVFLC